MIGSEMFSAFESISAEGRLKVSVGDGSEILTTVWTLDEIMVFVFSQIMPSKPFFADDDDYDELPL